MTKMIGLPREPMAKCGGPMANVKSLVGLDILSIKAWLKEGQTEIALSSNLPSKSHPMLWSLTNDW